MRRSTTRCSLLRSIPGSGGDADLAEAVADGRRVEICPLAQAANPPSTTFDSIDVAFDATIPYDLRFFQSPDNTVQNKLWLVRHEALIGRLKSAGIEKGKPFTPDVKTRDVHKEARAWLDARYHRPVVL